ncbi:AAA family ATPase [Sporolactobacillus sp. KGMB 08714]|uniref:AAA family ATPase n=1 Tax=Sporolactobacillus sp. KGMB 08714 TaxID=3064704 RepID=UPI003FA6AEAF
MDLFDFPSDDNKTAESARPLADRMRPRTLDEFVGQEQIVGKGRLLRRAIQADRLTPMIFFGPPGTGKTTLAHIIARSTSAYFEQLNAVTAGVGDLRKIIAGAEERLKFDRQRTILFIDEIHRFNQNHPSKGGLL